MNGDRGIDTELGRKVELKKPSWLPKEESNAFQMALTVSERGVEEGHEWDIPIRNGIIYLEGLLGRTTFPDDVKAKQLKKQLDIKTAPWQESINYDELKALRQEYAGTIRGDLEGRVNRLVAVERKTIKNKLTPEK